MAICPTLCYATVRHVRLAEMTPVWPTGAAVSVTSVRGSDA